MPNQDRWNKLQVRFDELSRLLSGSTIDPRERHKYQKEHSYLSSLLAKYREIEALDHDIERARQEAASIDGEMRELYED